MNRLSDRQYDIKNDRQSDWQWDRQKDNSERNGQMKRQRERLIDIQTERLWKSKQYLDDDIRDNKIR